MITAVQFCIAYVIVDFLCFVLNFIISTNVSRDSGSELQVRYFFMLLTANLVFVIFDATWAVLVFSSLFDPGELLLSVVNGINLTAIAFAGYFWFGFSAAYFESPMMNRTSQRLLFAIPAMLAVVFHTIGYFTGQNVIFHPDGTITYGIMHTIIALIPLLYLVAATEVAVRRFRSATTQSQKRMCLVFILFMLPPASAAIFDMIVPDMPVAAAGMMIAIVFVMMSMQESRISSDALTGLNNRRRAEAFLEERMARASADQPLYLLMIDMDLFKVINDTYGHLEGDRALQLMAEALRASCAQTGAFAARWGGDEFVVIGTVDDDFDPQDMVRLLQDTLAHVARDAQVEYELACSAGCAICTSPSRDLAGFIAEADERLYEDKQARRSLHESASLG